MNLNVLGDIFIFHFEKLKKEYLRIHKGLIQDLFLLKNVTPFDKTIWDKSNDRKGLEEKIKKKRKDKKNERNRSIILRLTPLLFQATFCTYF